MNTDKALLPSGFSLYGSSLFYRRRLLLLGYGVTGFRAKRKSNCRVCLFLSKEEKVDFELAFWKKKFFKNFFDILQWYFSDPEIPKLLMWLEGRLPKWLNMCEMADLKLENFPRCLFQMTSFICMAGSDDLRIHCFCHTAKHENISTMSAAFQMLTSYPLQKGHR